MILKGKQIFIIFNCIIFHFNYLSYLLYLGHVPTRIYSLHALQSLQKQLLKIISQVFTVRAVAQFKRYTDLSEWNDLTI